MRSLSSNSPVFILSSQRSGSTWTGYVLGSHSQSAFLGEYFRAWRPELRVPCPWCAASGLTECEVLSGIEDVPESEAFEFAFRRLGKKFLVDTSKSIEWAESFCKGQFDTRLIHLLRDPRGYYSSQRRRFPANTWDSIIPDWVEENNQIASFLQEAGLPHKLAIYDELSQDPALAFAQLFQFLGLMPEVSALSYWERSHHALAANGASSLVLGDLPEIGRLSFFITGDESFYSRQGKRNFHDNRWIQDLSEKEKALIENNVEVVRLLRRYGLVMNSDGLRREPA